LKILGEYAKIAQTPFELRRLAASCKQSLFLIEASQSYPPIFQGIRVFSFPLRVLGFLRMQRVNLVK
jgi:hypothetical protein